MKIYKYLLHFTTGKSEIERILDGEVWHSNAMSLAVSKSLLDSTMMPNVRHLIFDQDSGCNFDSKCVSTMIADYKRINRRGEGIERLPLCIRDIQRCNIFLQTLETQRLQTYQKEKHIKLLETLWRNLMKKERFVCEDQWQDVGFQSKKPQSDFRGMGILGLKCLVYLSSKNNELCTDILKTYTELSFAITAINIASFTYESLRERHFDIYFFDIPESAKMEEAAFDIFAHHVAEDFKVFLYDFWARDTRYIMDFPFVMKRFRKSRRDQLSKMMY